MKFEEKERDRVKDDGQERSKWRMIIKELVSGVQVTPYLIAYSGSILY